MTDEKKRPRVRVAAIIVRDGRMLLACHERDGRRYWLPPGGGVDFGETVGEALVRELREEANLDIRVGDLVLVNDSVPPDRHRHVLNLFFTAEVVGGELRVGNDPRLVGMVWVALEQLPELTFYPDVRESILRGVREGFGAGAQYLGNLWKD